MAKTDVTFTLSEPQSFDVLVRKGFEVATAGSSGVAPVGVMPQQLTSPAVLCHAMPQG